ncbi:hypothetical protein [Methylobacterium oryzisoli]|uniref:hypothetical protein n=1 Tax=Methylobacterium oryzisoli TaxID=3385502 RepID=UPI003892B4E3
MVEVAEHRDVRQEQMRAWVTRNWGAPAMNRQERVERLLEEAMELAQAEGLSTHRIHTIMLHVFSKPRGEPAQEVGGVSNCLLAYCAAAGLSADDCEVTEMARILNKTPEHFRARHQAKVDAGMATAFPVD